VKESYLQRTSTVRPIFRLLPLTKAEPNPSPSFQVVPLLLMPGHWRNMEGSNLSQETAFKLLGLTRDPQLQKLLFTVFLGTHTITVLGSLIMFLLIHMSALHIPYSLLKSLSFSDFYYSSTVVPQTLVNFSAKRKVISYFGCMAQLFFCEGFTTSECSLIATLAYDRYAAICNPLMPPEICVSFIIGFYGAGFLISLIHTSCIFSLKFCGAHMLTHFCAGPPVLSRCVDTMLSEILFFLFAGFNFFFFFKCTVTILVFYLLILISILRMNSVHGRFKAFSTRASHLTAVCLFYGTILVMYLRPRSSYSLTQDHTFAVIYTVIIPMLNPLIYSLRNKNVKKVWGQKIME
uniref:Olfactory receptor 5AU1 n=1 Tax=Mustela putorius furo TaxID=9669 RepID=M3XM58_MUSPF